MTPSNAAARLYKLSIIDGTGEMPAGDLMSRVGKLAGGLAGLGVGPGTSVGILCRNHRMFVEALRAANMVGADIHYLNTEWTLAEFTKAVRAAKTRVLFYDEEFSSQVRSVDIEQSIVAFPPTPEPGSLEDLIAHGGPPPVQAQRGRQLIFTSGTEGQPKLVSRSRPVSADSLKSYLSRVPCQPGSTIMCAIPLYHAWGLLQLQVASKLEARLVLPRYIDPYDLLALTAIHRPTVLATVPVVLRGMINAMRENSDVLPPASVEALQVIAVSGSELPSSLVSEAIEIFGAKLYSLYGSTEAGWISVATPADLQTNPATAGRPLDHVTVTIVNDRREQAAPGQYGRIMVSADSAADQNESAAEPVATGDIGHFDAEGRLFVDGRSDDMAVVGGKNVQIGEIENVLRGHPAILDAAVTQLPDEQYGAVLAAFVVRCPGMRLDAKELRAWLAERVARFKVPRLIYFPRQLPRNAAGKVIKRELADSCTRDDGRSRFT